MLTLSLVSDILYKQIKKGRVMLKIYNTQVVQECYRSEIIELTDEVIQQFKDLEVFPYTGTTNAELLEYIKEAIDKVNEGEIDDSEPEIYTKLYDSLYANVESTRLWSSLEKSGDSTLVLANEDDEEVAETEYQM